ncbi:nuclear exosome regulator NRDE2 [Euwallacea fornicatus]|uniref:nuclear exosome regulator NRDE2 n=1 Tax=Euwallacea fornicatus TaxID=995702 RepID=UPI00338D5ABA
MSLFAAYAKQAKELEENQTSTAKPEWLENSSFQAGLVLSKPDEDVTVLDSNEDSATDCSEIPKAKKKKKEKKGKQKEKKNDIESRAEPKGEIQFTDDFAIDRKQTREYLTVNTISRPAVSKYRTNYYLSKCFKNKKSKIKRYFKLSKLKDHNKSDNEEKDCAKLTKHDIEKTGLGERNKSSSGFIQEKDLSKSTATYNKHLAENPNDIEMWLKYVNFQDSVHQFEKSCGKGSIVKAQRVQAERKIAILDKAITLNPGNEPLLRERLKVAVSAFPADELQQELKKLVEKEKHNIILWQGYIEATQCSMSHCNCQTVLALYSSCLGTLHQLRRTTLSEKYVFEESILKMLYQCGLFLKQSGLFEQLWTLLKMYLELNLNSPEKKSFNLEIYFNEKELLELEEVVLNSQLPHHELWLRVEKLRESCHWLPHVGDLECEDPQRLVLSEDVAELIHPITTPENIFKLVATILTLLKIPLLPCKHCTMQDLGLDYVPWSLDSVEALLPIFMTQYSVNTLNSNLLNDTGRLTVGPQYLKALPGQEEYLNFVLSIMENCAECLKGQDQTSVRVWWFRFQRLLITLENQGRFKMPSYLKKRIKSSIKDLLKREDCRNNEVYYIEYALIEQALGNLEQGLKVLNIALKMNKNKSIQTNNWSEAQTNQCRLYRTLVEFTMEGQKEDMKQQVQELLVKLALQRSFVSITNGLIMEAESRYKSITNALLGIELTNFSSVYHFLPEFFTDWVICYGWFLFWTKGAVICGAFLESTLAELEAKSSTLYFQKETIYEFYCTILFKHCSENPGSGVFKILDEVLFRAIEKFPNNLHLLGILAKEQGMTRSSGVSAWKVQSLLLKSGRAMATIFTVIINNLVMLEIEKDAVDSVTGRSIDLALSFKNRMLSLFKKITAGDMCTRRCGLAWRLYLQFVHTYFDSSLCRNVYYRAVEECPWLKALYIDAAIYIPAELAQIQDLIIEKELRLHVTPEELDILRA